MSADDMADSLRVAGALGMLLAPLIVVVAFGWFIRFFRGRAV